ncbi:MAG: DUF1080 domain-containing protein [Gemmataceae bacterium]
MRTALCSALALLVASALCLPHAPTGDKKDPKKEEKKKAPPKGTFIDPKEGGPDYAIQGEYTGALDGGAKLGIQVIALGGDTFQAVVLPGGLPGEGWDGKNKILMHGVRAGDQVTFTPAEGKRNYLAGSPKQFSATSKFPPAGQKDYSATISSASMTGKTDDGKGFTAAKVMRKSKTLGMKAPEGAVVLFDGKDASKWRENRIADGLLPVEANTKDAFKDFKLHLEFILPFQPGARGQGRGNSGVYLHGREIQVLDSFGLDGKNNECGGIYGFTAPKVNMCYPPLTWQTYDVEIKPGKDEKTGKEGTRMTVWHNGVVIHENIDFPGGAAPIHLQNHGNPVFYRNIWLVERK